MKKHILIRHFWLKFTWVTFCNVYYANTNLISYEYWNLIFTFYCIKNYDMYVNLIIGCYYLFILFSYNHTLWRISLSLWFKNFYFSTENIWFNWWCLKINALGQKKLNNCRYHFNVIEQLYENFQVIIKYMIRFIFWKREKWNFGL